MKRLLKNNPNTVEFNPNFDEINESLRSFSKAHMELMNNKASSNIGDINTFSTENIVGEYAELLVCQKLNLTQNKASAKGIDAKDGEIGYQIKSRWLGFNKVAGKQEMGKIKKASLTPPLHFIIVILFNEDFSIKYAYKIPAAIYQEVATEKDKKTACVLRLTDAKAEELKDLKDKGVEDIRDKLIS